MKNSKKIILGTLVFAVFVLIVSLVSLYVQTTIESGNACGCVIPLPFFIPFIGSVGLFIGTLIYYFFSPRFESVDVEKDIVLRLLVGDESIIMRALTENSGILSQAEIVKKTGMSKVRVFRAINKMVSRGIIKKKSSGKTNIIQIDDDIKKLFI